jgi:predicted transglutaminase-like cysteine proteinase
MLVAVNLVVPCAVAGPTSALDRIRAAQGDMAAAPVAVALSMPRNSQPMSRESRAPGNTAPNVFGSVAIPIRHTPLDSRWRRVAQGASRDAGAAWGPLLRAAAQEPREARLFRVNRWVNAHIAFTPDRSLKGSADSWASLAESVRRGRGDCEDYALAKLQLLRAAGFAEDELFFVVVRDLVRRADHAVLVVRLDGRLLVLDNGTDAVTEATTADYRPIFSFAGNRSWIHGYATKQEAPSSGATVRAARRSAPSIPASTDS